MQNKALKQREDHGWQQLRKQLDVELPRDKKDDRKLLWFFLVGIGLAGLTWMTLANRVKPVLIKQDQTVTKPLEETAAIQPGETPTDLTATQSNPASTNASATNELNTKEATAIKNASSIIKDQTKPGVDLVKNSKPVQSKNDSKHVDPVNEKMSLAKVNSKSSNKTGTDNLSRKNQVDDQTKIIDETKLNTVIAQNRIQDPIPSSIDNKIQESKNESIPVTDNSSLVNPSAVEITMDKTSTIAQTNTVTETVSNEINSTGGSNLELPIALDEPKMKHRRNSLYADLDYSTDKFYSGSIRAGRIIPISNKFYFSGQAGLGLQFNKSNSAVVGGLPNSNPGKFNYDAVNSSTFSSVNAGKILLDNAHVLSGFRGDTLILSANDQIHFGSKNQWMALVQAGIGYRIGSFWSIESGLHLRSYLNSSKDFLAVSSAQSLNNGAANFSVSNIYELSSSTPKVQWSWYINTGIAIDKSWGFQLQFIALPNALSLGINSGSKLESLNSSLGSQSGSATTASVLQLPIKSSSASLRLGIQYKF